MKTKFSTLAVIALFCFVSCAFAQATTNVTRTGMPRAVSSSPAVLALALTVEGGDHSCQSSGGWEWDGKEWKRGNGGDCKSVPEGGSTVMYISLAVLICLGAVVLRTRRRSVPENAQ